MVGIQYGFPACREYPNLALAWFEALEITCPSSLCLYSDKLKFDGPLIAGRFGNPEWLITIPEAGSTPAPATKRKRKKSKKRG